MLKPPGFYAKVLIQTGLVKLSYSYRKMVNTVGQSQSCHWLKWATVNDGCLITSIDRQCTRGPWVGKFDNWESWSWCGRRPDGLYANQKSLHLQRCHIGSNCHISRAMDLFVLRGSPMQRSITIHTPRILTFQQISRGTCAIRQCNNALVTSHKKLTPGFVWPPAIGKTF